MLSSGHYFVEYPSGAAAVWLTNINDSMFHYQSFSGKWELITNDRIIKNAE